MNKLNMQETFENVVRHLYAQGHPAMDESGACLYRGPNGTKCAVGCLIPDDLYKRQMDEDGGSVLNLLPMFPELWELFDVRDNNNKEWQDFLHQLQLAHDCQSFKSFECLYFNKNKLDMDLKAVATKFKLDDSFMSGLDLNRPVYD